MNTHKDDGYYCGYGDGYFVGFDSGQIAADHIYIDNMIKAHLSTDLVSTISGKSKEYIEIRRKALQSSILPETSNDPLPGCEGT